MIKPVLSELAERALLGIAQIDHLGNPEHAVLRAISIAEIYVDALLMKVGTSSSREDTNLEVERSDQHKTQTNQSWSERHKLLAQYTNQSLGGAIENQLFALVIELRNTIAHGAGTITIKQRSTLAKQLDLQNKFGSKLHAFCDGYHVWCNQETSLEVLNIVIRYIIKLDNSVFLRDL